MAKRHSRSASWGGIGAAALRFETKSGCSELTFAVRNRTRFTKDGEMGYQARSLPDVLESAARSIRKCYRAGR